MITIEVVETTETTSGHALALRPIEDAREIAERFDGRFEDFGGMAEPAWLVETRHEDGIKEAVGVHAKAPVPAWCRECQRFRGADGRFVSFDVAVEAWIPLLETIGFAIGWIDRAQRMAKHRKIQAIGGTRADTYTTPLQRRAKRMSAILFG